MSRRSVACDGSEFRAAEAKRSRGAVWALGGLVAGIVGIVQLVTYDGEGSIAVPVSLAIGGTIAELVGRGMMTSTVKPEAFDRAIQTIKVGETKMADVTQCMGQPKATTTNGDVQTVTDTAKDLKTNHTVVVTGKSGVVSDVQKTQAERE